ncbi:MAG: tRNA (N6-isopentenyl adenosine(37)-C2)-methylthiotransferase MiaB [Turicibacter sp.]|nr:tRNA (N6-isopentenyl adenosine(37)-C2)-methylthiotransferase MiaB [Turicibacter sp.]
MAEEKDYSKYFNKPSLKDAKSRKRREVNIEDFAAVKEMAGIGQGKHYHVKTYGCQMNEHDSEAIAGILEQLGYATTDDEKLADIIILNTCAIRENAENRVFGELGRLKPLKVNNPDLILGVCGCMSQEESVVEKLLKKYQHVDLIFGTHNIHRLPEYVHEALISKERVVEVWSGEGDIVENMPRRRANAVKGWVNIMYGCDEFCTYCIVPYTRGKERSRLPEDVINEVRELAAAGYKEVTLLGQNVNAYGKDFQDRTYTFGNLLDDLNEIDIPRIRFTTSHPHDFDELMIATLAKRGNLMEYVHLPVQSGNNAILKKMNRRYTRESYLQLVRDLRSAIPDVAITTDIIVGFPGETEEQFLDTMSLAEEVGYDGAYTFIYSPREGTPAAKMADDVTDLEKKDRLYRLNALINADANTGNMRFQDQVVEVLVEGPSKNDDAVMSGYTRHQKLVNFKADAAVIGQIVDVRITEAKTWHLYGELVSD